MDMKLFRSKNKSNLPKKYWDYKDLSSKEMSDAYDRRLYHNLKGSEFKKLITKHLTPKLKGLGFKGGGFNFRRSVGNYIHTIQIHGSRYGGEGYIEIGIHLDFIPDLFFGPLDLKKIQSVECFNRHSLVLPTGRQMVDYGTNEDEAQFSLNLMYEMIVNDGIPYFNLFSDYPAPFDQIEVSDLKSNNPAFKEYRLTLDSIRTTINLARIHYKLGNSDKSKQFCEYGLTQLEDEPNELWSSMFTRLMNGDPDFCYSLSERNYIQSEQDRIKNELDSL